MSTPKIIPYKSIFESFEIDALLLKVKENVYNKNEVDSKVSEAYETLMEYIVTTYAEIDVKIAEEVAKIVAGAPEDFDTLKELSDWLMSHEDSAASMNSAIQKNKSDISALDSAVDDINITLCPENKNLLKNTAISQTINGVTFTVNPDKSVTCNGTATENAFFVLGGTTHLSGSAITSGAPVGGGSKVWSIQIYETVDGVETIRANDYGEGNTRNYTEGDYFGKIVIRAEQTVENLTFYPMLRHANTDETYEPYKPTVTEQLEILKAEIAALKSM